MSSAIDFRCRLMNHQVSSEDGKCLEGEQLFCDYLKEEKCFQALDCWKLRKLNFPTRQNFCQQTTKFERVENIFTENFRAEG